MIDRSQQLLELIRLAEGRGFKLPKGIDSSNIEGKIDDEGYYYLTYLDISPDLLDDNQVFIDIERILFDPELSFIKSLCKNIEARQDIYFVQGTIWRYHAEQLLFSYNRIEYLVKTFLEI